MGQKTRVNNKIKIKVRFVPERHRKNLTEMGVCINGWQYNYTQALSDEQLRCIGIAIFRHLAKKRNKDGDQTEG